MKLSQASDLVMSLKGAGISCLVIMWAMRKSKRNWNRNDLATHTGWSRESVAMGLERLTIRGLTLRTNFENWQLSENGYQLNFDDLKIHAASQENGNANYLRVENFDSEVGGGFKKDSIHEHDIDSLKQVVLRVENFDSRANHEPSTYALIDHLILVGCTEKKAEEAILAALKLDPDPKRIELRILYWRGFLTTQKPVGHAGYLIAKRVSEGRDPHPDFRLNSMPASHNELKELIYDCERSYQNDETNTEAPT